MRFRVKPGMRGIRAPSAYKNCTFFFIICSMVQLIYQFIIFAWKFNDRLYVN